MKNNEINKTDQDWSLSFSYTHTDTHENKCISVHTGISITIKSEEKYFSCYINKT